MQTSGACNAAAREDGDKEEEEEQEQEQEQEKEQEEDWLEDQIYWVESDDCVGEVCNQAAQLAGNYFHLVINPSHAADSIFRK